MFGKWMHADLACLFRRPANLRLVMRAGGFQRRAKATFTVQGWGTKTPRTGSRGPISGIFTAECSISDHLELESNHLESFILGFKLILNFPS